MPNCLPAKLALAPWLGMPFTDDMTSEERRSGVYWLVGGVLFLVAMLGMWWLVEETNEEGTHDAELLPFFALCGHGEGESRTLAG